MICQVHANCTRGPLRDAAAIRDVWHVRRAGDRDRRARRRNFLVQVIETIGAPDRIRTYGLCLRRKAAMSQAIVFSSTGRCFMGRCSRFGQGFEVRSGSANQRELPFSRDAPPVTTRAGRWTDLCVWLSHDMPGCARRAPAHRGPILGPHQDGQRHATQPACAARRTAGPTHR